VCNFDANFEEFNNGTLTVNSTSTSSSPTNSPSTTATGVPTATGSGKPVGGAGSLRFDFAPLIGVVFAMLYML
jgi:hypothetical protein